MRTKRLPPLLVCCLCVPLASAQLTPDPPPKDVPDPPTLADLPRNFVADQFAIWSSPFHPNPAKSGWFLLFAGVTGGLIATDHWTSKQLPNTRDQIRYSGYVSDLGAFYSIASITGSFYVVGSLTGNEKARETGLLGGEALADGMVVLEGFKLATQRQRPLDGDGHGHFFHGGSSFPSGHSMESFLLASVVAHEYRSRKVSLLAYGLASAVAASRFTGRNHFASDIVGPSAVGWLIGTYVYDKREVTNRTGSSALKAVLAPQITPVLEPQAHQYAVALEWQRSAR